MRYKNSIGIRRHLDVNWTMVKRAFCVALGLVGACPCLPVVAQQANRTEWPVRAFDRAFALSLYQPKISGTGDSFLLFRRGPVRTWSDGGWLASENALAQIGMVSLDLFPVAFSTPEFLGGASGPKGNGVRDSRSENSRTDAKDNAGEVMESPLDRVYFGGEVGVLYGRWSGKGGGDMWQTYVVGTVGNDKFQITAGASYDEWSGTGRGVRFRSFAAPR
jgi:hypothetical protein